MIPSFDYHHQKEAVHKALIAGNQPCVIKNLLCYQNFIIPESSAIELNPVLHWVFCQFEDSGLYPQSILNVIRDLPGVDNIKTRLWSNEGLNPITPLHWEGGARTFLNTRYRHQKMDADQWQNSCHRTLW